MRRLLPKAISRCQSNCGKRIKDKDGLIVKSYGTASWTDHKAFCRTRLYYIKVLNFKRLKVKEKAIKIITGEKVHFFLLHYGYNDIFPGKTRDLSDQPR